MNALEKKSVAEIATRIQEVITRLSQRGTRGDFDHELEILTQAKLWAIALQETEDA